MALLLHKGKRNEQPLVPNAAHSPKQWRDLFAAMKACSKSRDLERAKSIHEAVVKLGCDSQISVANTLVNMYAKCGDMAEAQCVFDGMRQRDAVSWTALILGYVENGESDKALESLATMQGDDASPDALIFVAALKACSSSSTADTETVMAIHAFAAYHGCQQDVRLGNTLLDVYGKLGSLCYARRVFGGMQRPTVVSWTSLMLGHAEYGEENVALQLLSTMMVTTEVEPDGVTYAAAAKACSNIAAKECGPVKAICLHWARALHSLVASSSEIADVFVENCLVEMYGRCGSSGEAWRVFQGMNRADVVSWTALIAAHAENGLGEAALQLFARLLSLESCEPNSLTFMAALKACIALAGEEDSDLTGVKAGSLVKGMVVHGEAAVKEFDRELRMGNLLIDMYSKCGSMLHAKRVFDAIQIPSVVSWTALMFGYVHSGQGDVALEVYTRMGCAANAHTFVAVLKACCLLAGKGKAAALHKARAVHVLAFARSCNVDMHVASALVDVYGECGSLVDARRVFERMPRHDSLAWNALIFGYAGNGEGRAALDLYDRMKAEGCEPDPHTFVAVLKACAALAALEAGRSVHVEIRDRHLDSHPSAVASLVDFYGKCGCMVDAQEVFDSVGAKSRDLVSWNALMAGYSRLGDVERVVRLFDELVNANIQPDAVTFLCILSACGHAGLVDQGREYFELMSSSKFKVGRVIEHYHCMIDMLGRANHLDEAMALVKRMPFEANVVTWTTVLDACRKWKNVQLGELAFQKLMRLDANDSGAYVLLKNVYS